MGTDWVADIRIVTISSELINNWTATLTTEERSAIARLRHYCLIGIIGSDFRCSAQSFYEAVGQPPDFVLSPDEQKKLHTAIAYLNGPKHLAIAPDHQTTKTKEQYPLSRIAGYCGSTFASAPEAKHADLALSDWTQLEFGLARANPPVRYIVKASTIHAKVSREFIKWMRVEHGADLLKQCGCEEFRVFRQSETELSCEYLFRSDFDLQRYLREHAPLLRERGREMFPEHLVTFSRTNSELLLEGYRRGEEDLISKPYSGIVP